MSLDAYLQEQGFSLEHSDKEIRLEKKRKLNIVSIIIGAIAIPIFVMIGIWLKDSMVLMFVIAALTLFVVMRFNFRGARPITIFDWTYETMVKKSVWFFINSKTVKIEGYNGVDIEIIDLGKDSSEGVDEWQKTIYLNTQTGRVNVVDFYSEVEPMEPELKEIMQVIHDHLTKKK